ncbi:MAG: hypothetical protein JSV57_04525 [Candidatus Bathyarchaeota archaeon]|nr:MAG: hypothetical protein JSV57_04525 [Candidatus Bathyarchaeota archaeon]
MVCKISWCGRGIFVVSFMTLTMIAWCQISPVSADVPDVLSVEPWISGADTILNITVRHASPTSSHYIDVVEVDIEGDVQTINLDPPQSAPTFLVQYNMGEITETPTVQTRAHCNFHGWSSWSEPVVVPEFPAIYLLLMLVIVSIVVLGLKSKSLVR